MDEPVPYGGQPNQQLQRPRLILGDGACPVLRPCGDDLTRASIIRQAAGLDIELPMLLPGIKVSTAPKQFFPVR